MQQDVRFIASCCMLTIDILNMKLEKAIPESSLCSAISEQPPYPTLHGSSRNIPRQLCSDNYQRPPKRSSSLPKIVPSV